MALTGHYTATCSTARSGGVATLYLIDAADVTSMTKGSGVTSYATIALATAKHFWTNSFDEDTCEWRENVEGEKGLFTITQEIEWMEAGLSLAQRNHLAELMASSVCGMIAIVKDGTGLYWVIGYDDQNGKARPLKLVTAPKTTAKLFADPAVGTTITLRRTTNELAHNTTASIVIA